MATRPPTTTRRPWGRAATLLLTLMLAGCWGFGDATIVEGEFQVENRTGRELHIEAIAVEALPDGGSPLILRDRDVETVGGRWVLPSGSGLDIFLFDDQCHGDGLKAYDGLTEELVTTYDEQLCGLTEWRIEDEDLPPDLRPDDANDAG